MTTTPELRPTPAVEGNPWDQFLEVARMPVAPEGEPLEDRIRRLEEERAVTDLIHRYSFFTDEKRWDELFELFTDDAVRVLSGSVNGVTEGKQALRASLDTPKNNDPDADRTRHFYSNTTVRIAPGCEQAWLATYFTVLIVRERDGGYETGSHHGGCVFTVVKSDGRWRISHQFNITSVRHNPLAKASFKR